MEDKLEQRIAVMHAELSATQGLLTALLITLRKRDMIGVDVIDEALELAASLYMLVSDGAADEVFRRHATLALKAIEELRDTIIPHK